MGCTSSKSTPPQSANPPKPSNTPAPRVVIVEAREVEPVVEATVISSPRRDTKAHLDLFPDQPLHKTENKRHMLAKREYQSADLSPTNSEFSRRQATGGHNSLKAIRDDPGWVDGCKRLLNPDEEDYFFPDPLFGIRQKLDTLPDPEWERKEIAVGKYYTGEWFKGEKEGLGVLERPGGSIFTGVFEHDRQSYGRYVSGDGRMFEGLFDDEGGFDIGRFSFDDGSSFYGRLDGTKRTGLGKEVEADGNEYVGGWVDGLKDGMGVYRCVDRSVYTGGFHQGYLHGTGTFSWPDGSKYEGQWEKSKHHGVGKFSWPNGDYYEGNWRNNKQHGLGWKGKVGATKRQGLWDHGVLQNWEGEPLEDLAEVEIVGAPSEISQSCGENEAIPQVEVQHMLRLVSVDSALDGDVDWQGRIDEHVALTLMGS